MRTEFDQKRVVVGGEVETKTYGMGSFFNKTWSCEQNLMYRPHEAGVMQHRGVIL